MNPVTFGISHHASPAPLARMIGCTASAQVALPYWLWSRRMPVGVVRIVATEITQYQKVSHIRSGGTSSHSGAVSTSTAEATVPPAKDSRSSATAKPVASRARAMSTPGFSGSAPQRTMNCQV